MPRFCTSVSIPISEASFANFKQLVEEINVLYFRKVADIIINRKDVLTDFSAILEKIGYEPKGEQGIPGRFAFRQTTISIPPTLENKKWQEHHLYVCYSDSLALKNHIRFRDILLQDEKLRIICVLEMMVLT